MTTTSVKTAISSVSRIITYNRLNGPDKYVAIELCGEAGIGKTAMVRTVAEQLGLKLQVLNLAQYEEAGDFLGLQTEQLKIMINEETFLVPLKVLPFIKENYSIVDFELKSVHSLNTILSDIKPGTILLLDDYTRANPSILQAFMEILHKRTFAGVKLPDDVHIVCTTNPSESGKYNVVEQDEAQQTRVLKFNVEFSVKDWIEWGELNGIDSRLLNFVGSAPEVFNDSSCNARVLGDIVSPLLKHVEFTPENMEFIKCILPSESLFEMFKVFLSEGLDKLPSPQELLESSNLEEMLSSIEPLFIKNEEFRVDLSGTLANRLIAFLKKNQNHSNIGNYINRLPQILQSNIFNEDIRYQIVVTASKEKELTGKIAKNLQLAKYLI